MSVQADPYYDSLDDAQAVTLSATRNGTESTDAITKASIIDRKFATRVLFGGIALQANEQAWNVPDALLVNITDLRPGDTLTHGSTVWHIREVVQDALATQWNLKCDKERD